MTLSIKVRERRLNYHCAWYKTVGWAITKYEKHCFSLEAAKFLLKSLKVFQNYNNYQGKTVNY